MYRIKKKGKMYFPQKSFLKILWFDLYESPDHINYEGVTILPRVRFNTKLEAQDYIDKI